MKKYLVNSAIFILIMGLFIISGYDKSELQTKEVKKQEATLLPDDLDYHRLTGLKAEAKQRFSTIRPRTLGQAARISGITPADVTLLMIWLEKRKKTSAISE